MTSAAFPPLSLTFELDVNIECVGRAAVIQIPVEEGWQLGLKSGLGLRLVACKGPGFGSTQTSRDAGGVEAGAWVTSCC